MTLAESVASKALSLLAKELDGLGFTNRQSVVAMGTRRRIPKKWWMPGWLWRWWANRNLERGRTPWLVCVPSALMFDVELDIQPTDLWLGLDHIVRNCLPGQVRNLAARIVRGMSEVDLRAGEKYTFFSLELPRRVDWAEGVRSAELGCGLRLLRGYDMAADNYETRVGVLVAPLREILPPGRVGEK